MTPEDRLRELAKQNVDPEKIILKLVRRKIDRIIKEKGLTLLTPDVCEEYYNMKTGLVYHTTYPLVMRIDSGAEIISNYTDARYIFRELGEEGKIKKIKEEWIPAGKLVTEKFSTDIKSRALGIYDIVKVLLECVEKSDVSEADIYYKPSIKDFTSSSTFNTFGDLYSYVKQ